MIDKYELYKVNKESYITYILKLESRDRTYPTFLQIDRVNQRVDYSAASCSKEVLGILFWKKKGCYGGNIGTILGNGIKGYEGDKYTFNQDVLDITYHFFYTPGKGASLKSKKLEIKLVGI